MRKPVLLVSGNSQYDSQTRNRSHRSAPTVANPLCSLLTSTVANPFCSLFTSTVASPFCSLFTSTGANPFCSLFDIMTFQQPKRANGRRHPAKCTLYTTNRCKPFLFSSLFVTIIKTTDYSLLITTHHYSSLRGGGGSGGRCWQQAHFAGCLRPFAHFSGVEGCTLLDVCSRLLALVV